MAGGRRILLVEDDPEIGPLIGAILGDEGYLVTTTTTEEQALAALAGARFDLVLTDVLVGVAAGEGHWSVIERIRAAADGAPVVICTAHDPKYLAEFAARGFGGLITKPFDIDDLLGPIARLLGGARHAEPGASPG